MAALSLPQWHDTWLGRDASALSPLLHAPGQSASSHAELFPALRTMQTLVRWRTLSPPPPTLGLLAPPYDIDAPDKPVQCPRQAKRMGQLQGFCGWRSRRPRPRSQGEVVREAPTYGNRSGSQDIARAIMTADGVPSRHGHTAPLATSPWGTDPTRRPSLYGGLGSAAGL